MHVCVLVLIDITWVLLVLMICYSQHNPIDESLAENGGENATQTCSRLYREPLGGGIAEYGTPFKVFIKRPH